MQFTRKKLKQIDTEGGDKLNYLYDSTGNRIKKTSKTSGVVVYSFDGLYEIARTPGEGDKHTLYFKGLYGDIFSQMTRNDAQLIALTPVPSPKGRGELSLLSLSNFCEDVAGSCSQYYINTAKYYYVQSAYTVARVVYSVEYDVFVWLLLVVVIALTPYFIPIGLFSLSFPSPFVRKEMLSGRGGYNNKSFITENLGEGDSWFAKRTLSVTPLLTVAVLFTFTQCGIIGGGKKKGDAPWLLLASGVNANTPSVDSPSNGNSSGGSGGSGGSALVPVVGMYFLHPDHLGSITMITDGRGNVIAGGNNGGKSHISYTPYGSIHRTDSSGPDITRFKYTGQEEDKESGLLYYKARYYDPMIGRFLQADSVVMPQSTFGMNRFMYVEGDPVRYGDSGGNARHNGDSERQLHYLVAAAVGFQQNGLAGAALGMMAIPNAKHRSWEHKARGNAQIRPEKYNAKDALADVARGFQRIAHDVNHFNDHAIPNAVKWASHGLQRAADTVNLLNYGPHHNENTIWHKYARSYYGRLAKKYYEWNRKAAFRNRHCISLGVQVAALVYTGYGIYEAGAAAGTGALSIEAFAGYGTPAGGIAGFFGASDLTVGIANIIYNTQDIAKSPIGIIEASQKCQIKSL